MINIADSSCHAPIAFHDKEASVSMSPIQNWAEAIHSSEEATTANDKAIKSQSAQAVFPALSLQPAHAPGKCRGITFAV
jgi:hypothetical protein